MSWIGPFAERFCCIAALAAMIGVWTPQGASAAGVISGTAGLAGDMTTNCVPIAGESEFATFLVDFRQIDIGEDAGGELDNDLELEFQLDVRVRKTGADKSAPFCTDFHYWRTEVPELNIIYGGFYVYPIRRRLFIENVPRNSVVTVDLRLTEKDDGGIFDDDGIDFNPYGGLPSLYLELFPADGNGATVVGQMQNRRDIDFGRRKRVQGDGEGAGSDYPGAAEFVVTMKVQPNTRSLGPATPPPGKPPGKQVGGAVPNTETVCRQYALTSVEQNQEAAGLGCGFLPPVWSNDHQMHFDWCMHGNNARTTPGHIANRRAALDTCRASRGGN